MSIYAKILLDSRNTATGDRLTTMEVEYPLMIHAEVKTHRAWSTNSASSRAIPVAKRLQRVLDDPMIPVCWPKNQPGMSASENLYGEDAKNVEALWIEASKQAVETAKQLAEHGVHKQIANRVVEPWCWMKTIISATEWENFFALRTATDAHPDLQELAYWMLDAMMCSTPRNLKPGEWHVPYAEDGIPIATQLKVATARCARISYLTQDGIRDIVKEVELHDRLLASKHMSPFEHCAQALAKPVYSGNFRGWKQYRKTIAGETRSFDLAVQYNELKARRILEGKRV